MRPAPSIIVFTTLAGVAQGLAVLLAVSALAGAAPRALPQMLAVAAGTLVVSLAAAFFHLGHPLRAWRAMAMWRTSWMSREVIALPLFIVLLGAWAWNPSSRVLMPLAAIGGAAVLWYCTAMIYACIRFIQEWAHPLTVVNYTLIGLSSGCVAGAALAAAFGDPALSLGAAAAGVPLTALAWLTRALSLVRNAGLKPKSSIQSATGIRATRVAQISMGMTGGSFNTREFFHGASRALMRNMKSGFQLLAFALPLGLLGWALLARAPQVCLLALPVQLLGILAERWFFFAQASHPQNLYYQVVS